MQAVIFGTLGTAPLQNFYGDDRGARRTRCRIQILLPCVGYKSSNKIPVTDLELKIKAL
jgi:hypothetical protein